MIMRNCNYYNAAICLCCAMLMFTFDGYSQVKSWQALVKNKNYRHSQLALSVYDVESQKALYEYNSEISLTPASSLKVLTTFISLDILGGEYQYVTKVYAIGEISQDGTLHGDVVIRGSGDPSLGSPKENGVLSFSDLTNDIIKKIKTAGIKCIDGTVIVDEKIFDAFGVCDSWSWDDLTNYYASGTYGFNINENYFDLTFFRDNSPLSPTSVESVNPHIPNMELVNLVTTGAMGSGDNAYLFGDPYQYNRTIKGTIPPGRGTFTIKGAIPRPGDFFRNHLLYKINEGGIKCSSLKAEDSKKENVQNILEVALYKSPRLSRLIARANSESNNLYCESFLKTIAAKELNRNNISYEDGVRIVEDYIKLKGLNTSALAMYDGSGLSIKNKVSTGLMARFLSVVFSNNEDHTMLLKLLPKAGIEGSVRNLLKGNKKLHGNIWLKSGSMGSVQSYTGVIRANSGKLITISMVANGHQFSNSKVRKDFESIIAEIYSIY